MAVAAGSGCAVALDDPAELFTELPSRFVVATTLPDELCARARALGIPSSVLGRAGGDRFALGDLVDLPLAACARPTRAIWPACWGSREGAALCDNGDTVKEACGVFGVYAPGRKVANLTFDGLFALQHRGQESAGMAVSDGDTVTVVKDMGLVATVFDERKLSGLQGHLAIGHTRYSTHGASDWDGAQPVYRPVGPGRIRPRSQRQPDQHHRAGREGRHAARIDRHRQRRGGRAAGPRLPRDRGAGRRAAGRAAHCRGRLLLRAHEHPEALRRARPLRLPAAVPRPPGPGGGAGGLGARIGDARPQRHRRHVRPRDRSRRAGGHRRRRRAQPADPVAQGGHPPAVHLRVRLHRPPGLASSTGARCTRPVAAWASCWPRSRRSRPTWSWGCPSRAFRRPRGSPGPAASPTGRGW